MLRVDIAKFFLSLYKDISNNFYIILYYGCCCLP